jgi:acetyl coenzyme A synthetase (ADP forming)-like protein
MSDHTTLAPEPEIGAATMPATDVHVSRPPTASGIGVLLAPRTIAVIGASRRPATMGNEILHNLLTFGFTGAVYPVNPNAQSVCGVRAYPSISDVPDPVDVAVIVVPREHALDVAEECGEAGVKGLIVISAGFKEVGAEGLAREKRLVEIVRRHRMRMVGPNCMGIINADPAVSMNATFTSAMPPFGHAGFVSQSGALGMSVLDYAREYGIGISQFVSVGNKPDVSGNDLLEQWERDPAVTVILMYVENFGNPARFLEIAGRITKRKPIIVVKSGRSRAGARAASSHTGALAASDSAVDALLTQAGVLRATSIEELFDMAMAFEVRSLPKSRRTAVLTNAGGPGILAADAMEASGLDLVELSPTTVEKLRPLFPPEASIRNPLDMIASATPAGYNAAMTALLSDPAIDAVVPIFVPPLGIKQEDVAEAIVGAATKQADKPVLAVLMGRKGLPLGRAELHEAKIPTYIFPESAARALATLSRHVEWAARAPRAIVPYSDVDKVTARAILDGARRDGRDQLTQVEALELLRAYGIPTALGRTATNVDDAAQIAGEIGYPVVMKVLSADIVHKTDVGGVRVGIASETDLRSAYADMMSRIKTALPEARVEGVFIQKMVSGQREMIAGVTRDPSFGALVMFGLGGVYVEALRDVVFRIAPVDDSDAQSMMSSIRGARLLDSIRGSAPVDRAAIASVIRRLGQLAIDCPDILELDVNPLLAQPEGALAIDARARVST